MIKKLFFYLLKRYSRHEHGRLLILSKLEDEVSSTYHEQTLPGNVYNTFAEFVIANKYIKQRVKEKDLSSIIMMRNGIVSEYNRQILFMSRNRMDLNGKEAKLINRKYTINKVLSNGKDR